MTDATVETFSDPMSAADIERTTQNSQFWESFVNGIAQSLVRPGGGDAVPSFLQLMYDIMQAAGIPSAATIAAGLSATASTTNKYFGVWPNPTDGLTRLSFYRNAAGVAVFQVAIPSAAEFDAHIADPLAVQGLTALLGDDYALSGYWSAYVDADDRIVFAVDDAGTGLRFGATWLVGGPNAGLITNQNLGGQILEYLDPADYALSQYASAAIDADGVLVAGDLMQSEIAAPAAVAAAESDQSWVAYTDTVGGYSQVFVEALATGKRVQVSTDGHNETSPWLTSDGCVVWRSDRAAAAPAGLYTARLTDFVERPALALREIACWGDSFTDQGYPALLQTASGWTCHEFGFSSHTSGAIAARMCAVPALYAPVGGSIPASGAVALTPGTPGPLETFADSSQSITGTLAGVAGTFAYASGGGTTFTRTAAGAVVSVPAPVPFVWDVVDSTGAAVPAWRDMVHVLEMGRNNAASITKIVSDLTAAAAYLTPRTKRFVVWPVFNSSSETLGSAAYVSIAALNAAIKAAFPDNYIEISGVDLRQYIVSQYNPSLPQDVTDHANDITPTSLRADSLHLNTAGYTLAAQFIYQFMLSKGWF